MAPKRKNEATVTRRSSRSPAVKKTPSPAIHEGESAAKKTKITNISKDKPKDDDVELLSPRRRSVSSKKENVADGKNNTEEKKAIGDSSPAEKKSPPANDGDEVEGDEDVTELKTANAGKKHGKKYVADDEGSPAFLPAAASILSRTVNIEACTQCNSFKERAEKVKKGLESAIPGISVNINPEKPRRGYFEISEKRTEVILSLPNMKRPFTPMKKLNMDEVVGDLIKRFK